MNTTPSISDRPYTVVGGTRTERVVSGAKRTTLVVLHRGGKYRRFELFDDLQRLGFDEVLSIEPAGASYDIEALARQYAGVRFLLLHRSLSIGEQVNVGIQEAFGRVVMAVWNDTEPERIAGKSVVRLAEEEDVLCVVPMLRTDRGEVIPSLSAPAFDGGRLRVIPLAPTSDGATSLYPADYVGIYRRERFLQLGGFDPAIATPYWQKLDFGFRAHLWGEAIRYHSGIRVTAASGLEPENTTPDAGYRRFYLKNLMVRFRADEGTLPASRFPGFYLRTGGGLAASWSLFRETQRWVQTHRYRFVQDARRITELWEPAE